MAIYRANRKLGVGIARGAAFLHTRLSAEARRILERKGMIYRLPSPPLALLIQFADYAPDLQRAGLVTCEDLLADTTPEFDFLRLIVWRMFNPPVSAGCTTCRRK